MRISSSWVSIPRSRSRSPSARDFLLRIAKARDAKDFVAPAMDGCSLLERVASPSNLAEALLHVARNRGAPGVDEQSVEEVVKASPRLLPRLQRDLLSGSYRPGEILRVWIPKPGSRDRRALGIPNVVDRWVQEYVSSGYDWIVSLDLSKFFDRVNHQRLLARLAH